MSESYKDSIRGDEAAPAAKAPEMGGSVGPIPQPQPAVQPALSGRPLRLQRMSNAYANAYSSLGVIGKSAAQMAGTTNAVATVPFSLVTHGVAIVKETIESVSRHAKEVVSDVAMAHADGVCRMTAHLQRNNTDQDLNLNTSLERAKQSGYTIEEMASGMKVTQRAVKIILDFEHEMNEEAKPALA